MTLKSAFLIAAIGLAPNLFASEVQQLDVMVTSRIEENRIGVLPDRSTILIECSSGIFNWSARLVFTNVESEFNLLKSKSVTRTVLGKRPSQERALSQDDANVVCDSQSGHFQFLVNEDGARLVNFDTVAKRTRSFGFGRSQ